MLPCYYFRFKDWRLGDIWKNRDIAFEFLQQARLLREVSSGQLTGLLSFNATLSIYFCTCVVLSPVAWAISRQDIGGFQTQCFAE